MTYLITRDDALAAIQEYAVQEVGASRTPNLKGAADAICDVPAINAATIREDALREAAAAISELADHAVTALAYEHAHACRDEILELIGEKK
jgi:hypothetical protein